MRAFLKAGRVVCRAHPAVWGHIWLYSPDPVEMRGSSVSEDRLVTPAVLALV